MRELLLKIRALLGRITPEQGGLNRPLAAAAAVALSMLEEGDLFAVPGDFLRVPIELPEDFMLRGADPMAAAGAAWALQIKNAGGVVFIALTDSESLEQIIPPAMQLNLPLVILLSCRESECNDISARVMADDMECIPADGRSVIKLMPAIRLAVDKAREGDGPTLIECLSDQLSEDEFGPSDPLERLNNLLIVEGYATPEELK